MLSKNIYQLDLAQDTSIISASLFMYGYSYIRYNRQGELSIDNIENLSIYDINFLDRHAVKNFSPVANKISDYLLYACLLAPFTMNFNNNISAENKEINFIVGEVYLLTGAVVSLSKTTFQKIRPYAYNEIVDMNIRQAQDAQYSFISGHTALAFAGAILTANIYNDLYPNKDNFWIYATSISTASTVGYLRYKAGKHFPSDVLTGAAVGTGIAFLMTNLHKNNEGHTGAILRVGFQF
ncbi:MAG: phosphatase PAP2 family protein [Candidatus Cloacimonetes bacterium]|nr:phosphatase PAP2 family protein [Candidatus Cloacimonadota bacterium]